MLSCDKSTLTLNWWVKFAARLLSSFALLCVCRRCTQAMRAVLDRPLRANYITVSTALNRVAKLTAERGSGGRVTDEERMYLRALLEVIGASLPACLSVWGVLCRDVERCRGRIALTKAFSLQQRALLRGMLLMDPKCLDSMLVFYQNILMNFLHLILFFRARLVCVRGGSRGGG